MTAILILSLITLSMITFVIYKRYKLYKNYIEEFLEEPTTGRQGIVDVPCRWDALYGPSAHIEVEEIKSTDNQTKVFVVEYVEKHEHEPKVHLEDKVGKSIWVKTSAIKWIKQTKQQSRRKKLDNLLNHK